MKIEGCKREYPFLTVDIRKTVQYLVIYPALDAQSLVPSECVTIFIKVPLFMTSDMNYNTHRRLEQKKRKSRQYNVRQRESKN